MSVDLENLRFIYDRLAARGDSAIAEHMVKLHRDAFPPVANTFTRAWDMDIELPEEDKAGLAERYRERNAARWSTFPARGNGLMVAVRKQLVIEERLRLEASPGLPNTKRSIADSEVDFAVAQRLHGMSVYSLFRVMEKIGADIPLQGKGE